MINTTYLNMTKPVFCVMPFKEAVKDDKYVVISKLDWIRVGNFIWGHWPQPDPQCFLLQEDKVLTPFDDKG